MMAADTRLRADFLAGAGEMGARIREFPWRETPLGPLEDWPQALKTSVSLILSSRHPMWIGWGRRMTFLYNDAYLHVLGAAKHPRALGLPASEVWAEIWDVCGPLADRVFESGEASFVDDVRLFMDRGSFLEETFYSFSYSPIRDDSGNVCGLFCPSTDVTPKVLNARRLATLSELGSNALVERTTAAACATAARTLAKNPDDVPFAMLYLAGAGGSRLALEQTVGSLPLEREHAPVISLEDAGNPAWPMAAVFRGGQRRTIALAGSPNGPRGVAKQPVLEAVALPVKSRGESEPYGVLVAGVNPCRPLDQDYLTFFELAAGQVATAIQNARAIEEEKKRADLLAELDRAKTAFFSNVSHEFRTPLTLMLGPMENLLSRPETLRPEVRQELMVAQRNGLRLLKLVNSLLDFSRLEAGRLKASYSPVDLSALTADLASNFRSAMESAGLELLVECSPLPEPVYVDREMWEKVVLNLLSNAFKFTFEGRVSVRLRAENGKAVLAVSDTGIGIPGHELPRIFERFHRVQGASGRTYEGAGIGLALIQEYVKLHGGTIAAASRVGEGSTFTVTLPFGAGHLEREQIAAPGVMRTSAASSAETFSGEALTWLPGAGGAASAASPRPPRRDAVLRVLVADDNADMREYISRILSADYEVATAVDGQQALELIRAHSPDLVLADVMMPALDGLELLRALRADAATRTLPVIFLSASAGEEARVQGLESGADDYLVKPFTATELRARVGARLQLDLARRGATEREAHLHKEASAERDRITTILECIPAGFIGLDRECRITYINAPAVHLIGLPRDELVGKICWELFPDVAGTQVYREFTRAREGATVDFETYYAPWRRWFSLKAYPSGEGGVSVFFEDISARKEAEDERAALLRRVQEARDESEAVNEIARKLAGELDPQKLAAIVTEAAVRITGAKSGILYYRPAEESPAAYRVYAAPPDAEAAFEKLGLPDAPALATVFSGAGLLRSPDTTADPDAPPARASRAGIRSCLGVPVLSRSGEMLGALILGHPRAGAFSERTERLAAGIAGSAAIALDNARLLRKAEHEIQQRRQTEDRLRESEQRFREMIDALPAAIYTTDAEGRLTHYNPEAARLSGRAPELGTDQWCVTWKLFQADGTPLPHDQCPMALALKGLQPASGQECIAERPDGSRFWFTPYPKPLRGADGRITGGINMLVDITARKAAEEALRRSEERFRGVFESSAVGVAILTLEARFLEANRAFCDLSGYSEEELRATSCVSLTHPEDRAGIERLLRQVVAGEIPSFTLEKRCLRKDGQIIWVNDSVAAMRDAADRPEYLIALCEDITGRKQAERASRESEEYLRAIVETTPECVKLVARDGTLLHMNSVGLALVGAASPEEVIGKSVYELVAPEFRDAFREFNEKVCAGEKGSLEFDILGLHGLRRNMETHAAPLRGPHGDTVQLAITRDVSERLRRERAGWLLGAIVDSSDDAIISKDLNGIITSWNGSAQRLFGYTAEEAVGKSVTILIPPDRLEEEPKILDRLRRGERVDHFETIRRRKDGALLDISLTISPVKDAHGKIIGASKIARDITDRKRSERAIQALNGQLTADLAAMTRMQQLSTRMMQADDFSQLLDEIVEAGIQITGADMGNIQLFENGAWTTASQRGSEAPLPDLTGESTPGRRERIIVDDLASGAADAPGMQTLLAAGARALQTTPLVSRSGYVLGMFSTYYRAPQRPGDRELRLLDVLARQAADLIERKRAESALLASERRFRQLADAMPQMVWTARPDGSVDYYNERWYQFTGFDPTRLSQVDWKAILHPEDAGTCDENWQRCIRSGDPYQMEYRLWDRAENRWRWFMGRALPVRAGDNSILKWFGTCTDIDEQKRVEDQLRRANQYLEQFAYSASHDLQEPLRSIKVYGELLSARYAGKLDGQALEFLEYLRSGATRMEMLVRDLLMYTQVGSLELPAEGADADEVLRVTIENLSGSIAESGARISADPLPSVRIHNTHLRQLFQNLISNAIKYRDPDRTPQVHVSAEQRDGLWIFSVRDNGIGIRPEYKEHVFGLFKRLHTSEEYSGTGIGLAICRRIVEGYHGRIWVESEPGAGSTFRFSIPV